MRKILAVVIAMVMILSGVAIADEGKIVENNENILNPDDKVMLNELSDMESIDNQGYLLCIDEGKYGDKKTNNNFSFNKEKFWGSMTDEIICGGISVKRIIWVNR